VALGSQSYDISHQGDTEAPRNFSDDPVFDSDPGLASQKYREISSLSVAYATLPDPPLRRVLLDCEKKSI